MIVSNRNKVKIALREGLIRNLPIFSLFKNLAIGSPSKESTAEIAIKITMDRKYQNKKRISERARKLKMCLM